MKSEDNTKGNDALCEVYAFLLQRRGVRLAQEAQDAAQLEQQAPSLETEQEALAEEQPFQASMDSPVH